MNSRHVLNGAARLAQKGILPIFDGSYRDEETGDWHDTWTIESEKSPNKYVLDLHRESGKIVCTCPALDYEKGCKHQKFLRGLMAGEY